MKNLFRFLVYLSLVAALVIVNSSCKDDTTDPVVSDFDALSEYMMQTDLDLPDLLNNPDKWVKPATVLPVDENDYSVTGFYVIDVRQLADFDNGHIKDAVHSTMADLLATAENAAGNPILVVCYTGQTAARATAALRMSGFEAYTLKWGMSAWHPNLNTPWENGAKDINASNWVSTGDPAPVQEFSFPVFNTGETTPANMLKARVQRMLQNSGWIVANDEVLNNPGNYFLNNFWPEEAWNEYGHITGAYRFGAIDMTTLKNFNPNKPLVTYCYTGQTSAFTTAWLEVLGYNAKSLKFGANGIVHSLVLNGTAGGGHKVAWRGGTGAGITNFGYYKTDGTFIAPIP